MLRVREAAMMARAALLRNDLYKGGNKGPNAEILRCAQDDRRRACSLPLGRYQAAQICPSSVAP